MRRVLKYAVAIVLVVAFGAAIAVVAPSMMDAGKQAKRGTPGSESVESPAATTKTATPTATTEASGTASTATPETGETESTPTPTATPETDDRDIPSVSGTPTREPSYAFQYSGAGVVTVTVHPDVRFAAATNGYTFDLPDGATVQSTHGVEQRGGTIVWDGKTDDPSFTFRVDASQDKNSAVGNSYTIYEHDLVRRTEYESVDELSTEPAINATWQVPDGAIKSEDYVIFGDLSIDRRTIDGRLVRIVVPDGVDPQMKVSTMFGVVANVSHKLPTDVNNQRPRLMMVIPQIPWGDVEGRCQDERSIFLEANDTSASLVAHEYVHTLQETEEQGLSKKMQWWEEASATYLGKYIAVRNGYVSFERFQEGQFLYKNRSSSKAILSNPDTWESSAVYAKGSTAIAEIDQAIRKETDGAKSLIDVYRRVNTAENVTLEEFLSMVETVGGPESRQVAKTYVTTNQTTPDDITRDEFSQIYGYSPANIDVSFTAVRIGDGPRKPVNDTFSGKHAKARTDQTVTFFVRVRNRGDVSGRIKINLNPFVWPQDAPDRSPFRLNVPPKGRVAPGAEKIITFSHQFRPGKWFIQIGNAGSPGIGGYYVNVTEKTP